jgi:hypothetical protein
MADPKDGIQGLPVKGYKQTQTQEAIEAVNYNKVMEEQVLRRVEYLGQPGTGFTVDGRWAAIARTHFQEGFMALNRAIFQPERISLPGDDEARLSGGAYPPGGGDDDSE